MNFQWGESYVVRLIVNFDSKEFVYALLNEKEGFCEDVVLKSEVNRLVMAYKLFNNLCRITLMPKCSMLLTFEWFVWHLDISL